MLSVLKQCRLLAGIDESEIQKLFACLSAHQKQYQKNEYILRAGEETSSIGIVLSGNVHIIQEDFWGNRSILTDVVPSELFAESFSFVEGQKLPISAVAVQDSKILFIHYRKLLSPCHSSCAFHTRLIENMLKILADKTVFLTKKMEFLSKRTIREKLLTYLSSQAIETGKTSFSIPFNRQELAEYLSVDRSALSNELSKMRKEGILNFNRNFFTLLKI